MVPFTFIKLDNGTESITAQTNLNSNNTADDGVFVAEEGAVGIVEPGMSSAEFRSRSFANGSVLNMRNKFSGKVFNIKLLITKNHKTNLTKVENIIKSNRVFISSDWKPTVYTCQFQKDGYTLSYDSITKTYEVGLIFAAEEAF